MAGNPNEVRLFPRVREDIPAVRHWDQSISFRAQRWYVQLCLLASAARDHMLAQDLASREHGNWSGTTAWCTLVVRCFFSALATFPGTIRRWLVSSSLIIGIGPDSRGAFVSTGYPGFLAMAFRISARKDLVSWSLREVCSQVSLRENSTKAAFLTRCDDAAISSCLPKDSEKTVITRRC